MLTCWPKKASGEWSGSSRSTAQRVDQTVLNRRPPFRRIYIIPSYRHQHLSLHPLYTSHTSLYAVYSG